MLEAIKVFPPVSAGPGAITRRETRKCWRGERQDIKNQSFTVASPTILDESGFRFPSMRDSQCAMLCPLPVSAAVEFFRQFANLSFFVVVSIKVLCRRQRAGDQETGVDR